MFREITRSITLLVCLLIVASESELIKDPYAIQNFLDCFNKEKLKLYNESIYAKWEYYNNITEGNEEKWKITRRKMREFSKAIFLNASLYDLSCMNPNVKRQFQKMINIGTDAQTNKTKHNRLNMVRKEWSSIWRDAKFCVNRSHCTTDIDEFLKNISESKDWDFILAGLVGLNEITTENITELYAEYVNLSNEAVQLLGYSDTGAYWRSEYESSTFEDDMHRLYDEISPFYKELHAFLRRKLKAIFGDDRFPASGHIPAHLIDYVRYSYEFKKNLTPFPGKDWIDITQELNKQNYTPKQVFEIADDFYKSLGMKALTPEFWENSILNLTWNSSDIKCQSLDEWDFYDGKDYRVTFCSDHTTNKNFGGAFWLTASIQYAMQYANQPIIFRQSVFPLKIADFSARSGEHGDKIGLKKVQNDRESAINMLLNFALQGVYFLPNHFVSDLWRWKVFRGEIKPEKYNEEYWNLMCRYDGLSLPVEKTSNAFHPFLNIEILSDDPASRTFVDELLRFEIHKALCDASGYKGPLLKCDYYNSKEAGRKLSEVLRLGSSKPFPELLQILTGRSYISAKPFLEYFQPLLEYLKSVNTDEEVGWKPECPTPAAKLCKASIPIVCTCKRNSHCEDNGSCVDGICEWN